MSLATHQVLSGWLKGYLISSWERDFCPSTVPDYIHRRVTRERLHSLRDEAHSSISSMYTISVGMFRFLRIAYSRQWHMQDICYYWYNNYLWCFCILTLKSLALSWSIAQTGQVHTNPHCYHCISKKQHSAGNISVKYFNINNNVKTRKQCSLRWEF